MDPNELTNELEEQARERKAEEKLAESAESGDTELTLDDLDGAAGGRVMVAYGVKFASLDPMAGSDGN